MFDEKDGKWIGYYKTYTIVMFWLYAAAAVVMCILGWSGGIIYIVDEGFLDGLICLVGGFLVAFVQLVCNMLIIQFLNNVQTIRESIKNHAPQHDASSSLEELKKYKNLLDMGVLTPEEYETKKVQLLEQI